LRQGLKGIDIAAVCVDGDGDMRGDASNLHNISLGVGDFLLVDLDYDVDH
jgi:hypothetical protein